MQRVFVLVVAVVVAALGMFAVRSWLDQSPRDAVDSDVGPRAARPDDAYSPNGAGESSGRARARANRGEREDRAANPAPANRRDATSQTVIGSRAGEAARANRADLPVGHQPGAPGVPPPHPDTRSDLLDSLPPRPPVAQQAREPVEPPAEHEDGLLLSVTNAKDIENADVSDQVGTDQEGLRFDDDSQLVYPDGSVKGDAGTIKFDLEPQWDGKDPSDNSFVQVRNQDEFDNRLQIVKNGRYLRFILADNTGRESDISYRIDDWVPGEQHRIAATWGDARTALYVDGRLVGQSTYAGAFTPDDTPLHIGSDYIGGDYGSARATIKNFKVYDNVLPDQKLIGNR